MRAMRADEEEFLDQSSISVVFTEGEVVVIEPTSGTIDDIEP